MAPGRRRAGRESTLDLGGIMSHIAPLTTAQATGEARALLDGIQAQ
jgi:hypothetical protein